MTKARNIADLLDANGDVKTASLDNVPASNDASALTTGTLPNARLPNNISDGGTTGTKVAVGTSAQRGSTQGQWRYNTDTGFFEGINTGGSISSLEPDPTISSIDDTEVDSAGGGNQTFVVTGTNFTAGGTISFIGNDNSTFNATSTTHNSTTQQTAVVPKASFINSKEPYDIKFTSATSKLAILENIINVDNSPVWQTASGNIINTTEDTTGNLATVSATDPDGDTVSYSLQSGSLGGLSLNSSTGVISGDPTDITNLTTYSPVIRATANGKTSDRTFTIIIKNPSTGGTITTYTYNSVNYKLHTFKSNGTFVLGGDGAVDIFVLGGGGSGGGGNSSNHGAGGGSGGLLWRPSKSLTTGNYTVTVGNGATWIDSQKAGVTGNNSIFTGSGYTLTGNGGGGGSGTSGSTPASATGGSGGGAGRDAGSNSAGASNQSNSQDGSAYAYGNAGGIAGGTSCTSAGGGGGTGQAGHNGGYDCESARDISGEQSEGGDGVSSIHGMDTTAFSHFLWSAQVGTDDTDGGGTTGALLSTLSSRPSIVRIGGGGGGAYETASASQLAYGGKGGGGRGGSRYPNGGGQNAQNAYANTGSGGGAGQRYNSGGYGGHGGSGVVIVRYTV